MRKGLVTKHSKTGLGSETNKQIEQNNNNKKSRRYLKFSLILQTLTYSCFHYLAMLVVGVGVSVCLVCVLGVGGGGEGCCKVFNKPICYEYTQRALDVYTVSH